MRRFFIVLSACILYCRISYGAEEGKEIKGHPTPEEMQKAQQQGQQQQRPILPPVVPQMTPMISPTPSPHITAPQIPPQAINPIMPQVNIPSATNFPVIQDIPSAPVIGNTIGKVINLGSEKDGSLWMEVNDDLFGESVRVKIINLKNTPIVKEARIYSFKDIKIGDTVNAMFHTEGENNIANFIDVLTEEEIEMMYPKANSESNAAPVSAVPPGENNNNQPKNQNDIKPHIE